MTTPKKVKQTPKRLQLRPNPILHAPWNCPYDPPKEMVDEASYSNPFFGSDAARKAATEFCCFERRCGMQCARKRPCLKK
jgi:hypothetical protein